MTKEEIKYFRENLQSRAEMSRAQAQQLLDHAQTMDASARVIEALLAENKELNEENKELSEENKSLQEKLEAEKKRNTIHIDRLEGNVIEQVENFNTTNNTNTIGYGHINTTDDGECDRTHRYLYPESNEYS